MKSVDPLKEEHQTILAMLEIVEAAASRLEQGGDVSPDFLAGALDFFANFADGAHHAKEEEVLFPLLTAHGLGPDAGPLIDQHEAGRVYLGDMRAAVERLRQGDARAREALVALMRTYVALLRGHIQLEDAYLFRLAAEVLSDAEDQRILEQMNRIGGKRGKKDDKEHYQRLVAEYREVVAAWGVSHAHV